MIEKLGTQLKIRYLCPVIGIPVALMPGHWVTWDTGLMLRQQSCFYVSDSLIKYKKYQLRLALVKCSCKFLLSPILKKIQHTS